MRTKEKTTLPTSNINNVALARYLASHRSSATFSSVIYTKVGVERGRKPNKKRYGDDTVLDTCVTGFRYMNLCNKDLATLESGEISPQVLLDKLVELQRHDKDGHIPSLKDCERAILDQVNSFRRSLDGTNVSTTDEVREPVIVDGKTIQGCWVNNGKVDPKKTGIPYLYGLRVGRKVLEEAPNGPIPSSNSRPDVVAKNVLKSKFLRVGRWMQVKLDPSSYTAIKLGGEAAAEADSNGIVVLHTDITVREIYEAA